MVVLLVGALASDLHGHELNQDEHAPEDDVGDHQQDGRADILHTGRFVLTQHALADAEAPSCRQSPDEAHDEVVGGPTNHHGVDRVEGPDDSEEAACHVHCGAQHREDQASLAVRSSFRYILYHDFSFRQGWQRISILYNFIKK